MTHGERTCLSALLFGLLCQYSKVRSCFFSLPLSLSFPSSLSSFVSVLDCIVSLPLTLSLFWPLFPKLPVIFVLVFAPAFPFHSSCLSSSSLFILCFRRLSPQCSCALFNPKHNTTHTDRHRRTHVRLFFFFHLSVLSLIFPSSFFFFLCFFF